jgi:hypothetical protein
MTDNADLHREYEPVVTCARHHQTLQVCGASVHRNAGVFELTIPETSGWSVTAHIHEHLVERISRTTLAPIKASIARWPSQYRAETDSHIAERKFLIGPNTWPAWRKAWT